MIVLGPIRRTPIGSIDPAPLMLFPLEPVEIDASISVKRDSLGPQAVSLAAHGPVGQSAILLDHAMPGNFGILVVHQIGHRAADVGTFAVSEIPVGDHPAGRNFLYSFEHGFAKLGQSRPWHCFASENGIGNLEPTISIVNRRGATRLTVLRATLKDRLDGDPLMLIVRSDSTGSAFDGPVRLRKRSPSHPCGYVQLG